MSAHNPAAVDGIAAYSLAGPKLAAAAVAPCGLSFDGINDYLTLPAVTADLSSGFTLEAWVYFDTVTNWARIFEFGEVLSSEAAARTPVHTWEWESVAALAFGVECVRRVCTCAMYLAL